MKTVEKVPCLYCGQPTDCQDYIINPKAHRELPCCCAECLEKTKKFVQWDSKCRTQLYLALGALVIANLFFLGFMPDIRWKYLPMLGIGLLVAFFPLVFAKYERYQAMGLKKTTLIVRLLAGAIAVFSIVLMVFY